MNDHIEKKIRHIQILSQRRTLVVVVQSVQRSNLLPVKQIPGMNENPDSKFD